MTTTLYDITEDCARLLAAIEAIDAMDMPEEDKLAAQQVIEAEYWQADGQLEVKAEGYIRIMREMETRADVRKAEAKRLSDLARSDENQAKRLKERLKDRLMVAGYEPGKVALQTKCYRVGIQANGGARPLTIDDQDALREIRPEVFTPVTTYVCDKDAIRKAIEAWEAADPDTRGDHPYPGATLQARGTRLAIR